MFGFVFSFLRTISLTVLKLPCQIFVFVMRFFGRNRGNCIRAQAGSSVKQRGFHMLRSQLGKSSKHLPSIFPSVVPFASIPGSCTCLGLVVHRTTPPKKNKSQNYLYKYLHCFFFIFEHINIYKYNICIPLCLNQYTNIAITQDPILNHEPHLHFEYLQGLLPLVPGWFIDWRSMAIRCHLFIEAFWKNETTQLSRSCWYIIKYSMT